MEMFVTKFILIQVLLIVVAHAQGRQEIGGGEQDWGHITVRPNAHMFWWLYYTTHKNIFNHTERPLLIWLEGGPGMSSSAYGNFLKIGPLNASFHKREGSFVENFNVLFVDNPVGVGFSYFSDKNTSFSTTGEEIAEDLYNFLKTFITVHHPEFKDVPIHVFGESYGGKMATEFVHKLKLKEKDGIKFCNVKTLALGDSYVSPLDHVKHYALHALSLGLIDKRGFAQTDNWVRHYEERVTRGDYFEALHYLEIMAVVLVRELISVDIYNFLDSTNTTKLIKPWEQKLLLEPIMNNEIRKALNISDNIACNVFSREVHKSLNEDFSKSVTHKIEVLLNTTDIKVIVYNGILDLITNTAGTLAWLDHLHWHGQEKWLYGKRYSLLINGVSEGYFKRANNLAFYAILRAGHSVPLDNLYVLNEILRLESLI